MDLREKRYGGVYKVAEVYTDYMINKILVLSIYLLIMPCMSFGQDTSAIFKKVDHLIQSNPEEYSNYMIRASMHYQLKMYQKAIPDISIVLDNMSEIPIDKRGRLGIDSVNMLNIRAICYREVGDISSAIIDFKTIKELNNDELSFRLSCALVYMMNEKYGPALKEYELILKMDSTNAFALTNTAHCLNKNGNQDKAIETLEKCIKYNPSHFHAFRVRGEIYEESNELEKACAEYRKCLSTIATSSAKVLPSYVEELNSLVDKCP